MHLLYSFVAISNAIDVAPTSAISRNIARIDKVPIDIQASIIVPPITHILAATIPANAR